MFRESLPNNGYTLDTILVSDIILYMFSNIATEISHTFDYDEDLVGYGFCSHVMFEKWNRFKQTKVRLYCFLVKLKNNKNFNYKLCNLYISRS